MAAFDDRFGGETPGRSGAGFVCRSGVDGPVLLAHWRSREVWIARQFRACGGVSLAEVEELYDATVAVLVEKGEDYESVEHLRRALHRGIKLRALRLHRDRGVHAGALQQAAPFIEEDGRERAWYDQPERALIAREDDVIVGEFIAELSPLERRVFALVADGRSWRAIATALGLAESEARGVTRACERKRARFLTLYSTGRLCGYRSQTIGALLGGRDTGELALGKALAHLRHCRACRVRHRTDVAQLRSMFDGRVAGLLPVPVLADRHSWVFEQGHSLLARFARGLQRVSAAPPGGRERALEVVAGSGVGAKVVAGFVGVALLVGGVTGAGGRLWSHHFASRSHLARTVVLPRVEGRGLSEFGAAPPARRPAPRRLRSAHHRRSLPLPGQQHTAGGFSYLGVSGGPASRRTPVAPAVSQRGGSPVGP